MSGRVERSATERARRASCGDDLGASPREGAGLGRPDHDTKNGLELAIDIALQASPDHPWVTEHPEWFTTLLDGTIAHAENPPKKYQDIYPLNFDNDPEGIYLEMLRVFRVWMGFGIKIFRVDNPHTKPLPFWERLIAEVLAEDRAGPAKEFHARVLQEQGRQSNALMWIAVLLAVQLGVTLYLLLH